MSTYRCFGSLSCIHVSVSLLSSSHSVVHRNVGNESQMVNFASDSLFKLDDVGMRNITKYFQHMSTWVLNYVL